VDAGRRFRDTGEYDDDLEATRIVSRVSGDRFVLQFSTGESFTVHGGGLIGRNPQPEPGEFFEHLVRVLDTGKSVSKTHLEFGQEGGAFWVKDRFSGNGTIIREPEASPRRAEADRRYRVIRGTRIDIGEQFFVVS
jgi:predicted component of type VI protein secretion system